MTSKDKGQQLPRFVLKAKSLFQDPSSINQSKRLKLLDAFKQYAGYEKIAAKSWLNILKVSQTMI